MLGPDSIINILSKPDVGSNSSLHSVAYIAHSDPRYREEDVISRANDEYSLVYKEVHGAEVAAVKNFMSLRATNFAYGINTALYKVYEFVTGLQNEKTDLQAKLEAIDKCGAATRDFLAERNKVLASEHEDISCLEDNLDSPKSILTHFLMPRSSGHPVGNTDFHTIEGARGSLSSLIAKETRAKNTPASCPVQRDANPLDPKRVLPSKGRGVHQCSHELNKRVNAIYVAEQAEKRQTNACSPSVIKELVTAFEAEQARRAERDARDPQGTEALRRHNELRQQIIAEQNQTSQNATRHARGR